jgi:ribosomal protein S27AE
MVVVVILLVSIPLVALFYFLAVQSRKSYHCPACGEAVRVEHMNAQRCGMCGAPLQEN